MNIEALKTWDKHTKIRNTKNIMQGSKQWPVITFGKVFSNVLWSHYGLGKSSKTLHRCDDWPLF